MKMPRWIKILIVFGLAYMLLGFALFPLSFAIIEEPEENPDFFREVYEAEGSVTLDVKEGNSYSVYAIEEDVLPRLDASSVQVVVKDEHKVLLPVEDVLLNYQWTEGDSLFMGIGLAKFTPAAASNVTVYVDWNDEGPVPIAIVSGHGKGLLFLVIMLSVITSGAFVATRFACRKFTFLKAEQSS